MTLEKRQAIEDLNNRALQAGPSITRELANAAMGTEGIIPLWFGEPNEPTPKFICDTAAASLANGETFYAEGLAAPTCDRLCRAICQSFTVVTLVRTGSPSQFLVARP
jgi:aspartate/methionine/tyrosine aminotransferase